MKKEEIDKQRYQDYLRQAQQYKKQFQTPQERLQRLKKLDNLFDQKIKQYKNQKNKKDIEKEVIQYQNLQKFTFFEEKEKEQDLNTNVQKKDDIFGKFQFQTIYLSDIKKQYTKVKSVDKIDVKQRDISFLISRQTLLKQEQKLSNSSDLLNFPNFDGIVNHKRSQINKTLKIIQTILRKKDQSQGIIDFILLLKCMKYDQYFIKKVYNCMIDQNLNMVQLYAGDDPSIHGIINLKLKQWKYSCCHLNYLRYPIYKMFTFIRGNYNKACLYANSTKGPIYRNGGTVFRGTFISQDQFQFLKKYQNSYIQMLGFLSTTLDKKIAQKFQKNVIFQIKIQSDRNSRMNQYHYGFCDLNQQKIAVFEEQNQILFNIKSIFKVLKAEKVVDKITNNTKYKIFLQYGIKKSGDPYIDPLNLTKQEKIAMSVGQFSSFMNQLDHFQGYTLLELSQIQTAKRYIKIYQYQESEKNRKPFYLALIYDKASDFSNALIHYKKAIELIQVYIKQINSEKNKKQENSLIKYLQEDIVKCLLNISAIYKKTSNWKDFFLVFKDLKKKINQIKEVKQNFYEAEMLREISNFYRIQNNPQKSKEYFEMSIKIQNSVLTPLDLSRNYKLVGRHELNNKNYKLALTNFQTGMNILYQEYGKEHPQSASMLKDIGATSLRLGLYDKALTSFNECLKMQQKCSVDPVTMKQTELNIGITLSKMARYNQSEQIVRKCHNFFVSKLGPNSRQAKAAQSTLQTVLTKKMYNLPAGSVLMIPK